MNKTTRISFGIASLILLSATFSLAQQKIRILDESDPRNAYRNPPVVIVSREFSGDIFTRGSKIMGGRDWIG